MTGGNAMTRTIQFRLFDEGTPPEGAPDGSTGTPPEGTPKGKESGGRTFTRDDIAKMLSAEKAKLEESYAEQTKKAVAEALRQAQLSEEDKRAEAEKQAEQARVAKEAELSKRELLIEAKELLVEKNLNKEFINVLNFESQEAMVDSIKALSEFITQEINTGIEQGVKKRLADSSITPQGGATGKGSASGESKNNIADFANKRRVIKS
jgi:hypothetical protein